MFMNVGSWESLERGSQRPPRAAEAGAKACGGAEAPRPLTTAQATHNDEPHTQLQ